MCCLAPKDLRFRCRSAGVYTELKYLFFWTAGEDPTVFFVQDGISTSGGSFLMRGWVIKNLSDVGRVADRLLSCTKGCSGQPRYDSLTRLVFLHGGSGHWLYKWTSSHQQRTEASQNADNRSVRRPKGEPTYMSTQQRFSPCWLGMFTFQARSMEQLLDSAMTQVAKKISLAHKHTPNLPIHPTIVGKICSSFHDRVRFKHAGLLSGDWLVVTSLTKWMPPFQVRMMWSMCSEGLWNTALFHFHLLGWWYGILIHVSG